MSGWSFNNLPAPRTAAGILRDTADLHGVKIGTAKHVRKLTDVGAGVTRSIVTIELGGHREEPDWRDVHGFEGDDT